MWAGMYLAEVRCEIYLSMDASLVLVVYLPGGPTMDNSFSIKVLYDLSRLCYM